MQACRRRELEAEKVGVGQSSPRNRLRLESRWPQTQRDRSPQFVSTWGLVAPPITAITTIEVVESGVDFESLAERGFQNQQCPNQPFGCNISALV